MARGFSRQERQGVVGDEIHPGMSLHISGDKTEEWPEIEKQKKTADVKLQCITGSKNTKEFKNEVSKILLTCIICNYIWQ